MNPFLNLPLACLAAALASAVQAHGTEKTDRLPAPLFDALGNLHHPVTTSSPLAQRYFDQGLTLIYAFNHSEAIRSFKAALAIDPDCAMAWWGIAYALGPNINRPMEESDHAASWDSLQKAVVRAPDVTHKEQAYIKALEKRYQKNWTDERADLDQSYAEAMRQVAKMHPDDHDASVLFAESLMNTMPWDYWTKDLSPKPATEEALQALRRVIRRIPDHPGANHYLIHLIEAGPDPESGISAADHLGRFSSQAGHLVHMPSHIYLRVGRYEDASESNRRAISADQSYLESCRVQGFYPGAYFPHNVHFLWYTTGLEGRSADSIAAAKNVAQFAMDARCGIPVVEAPRFRHLPLVASARFGRWREILQSDLPDDQFALDRAMGHYARGIAFAALKEPDNAARELESIETLLASGEIKKLDGPGLPATGILEVARRVLEARIAGLRDQPWMMIHGLTLAVAAEDALPYMEPPFWYYPVRQSLGAAWLTLGEPERAEAAFREDLERMPKNGWSLHGLAESLRQSGKTAAAESVDREFKQAWKNADIELSLDWY